MPEPPKWASDCVTCQTIWRRLTDPEFMDAINLGSHEEALSTSCPNHKLLVQKFTEYAEASNDIGFTEGEKGSSVEMFESISDLGVSWQLLLAKDSSIPHHPGTGRVLDPDWVDLGMLKEWKQTCLLSHGSKCENPFKMWPAKPAWLVDVKDKCLVSGQVSGRFVAVSCLNGEDTERITDANILSKLQEPHALETPELSQYMTPAAKHAMYLTSFLGERYLWADSLCIPHHDHAAAAQELYKMGAVYATAVVTIIGADGDSQTGLAGLKGVSDPRVMDQRVIPFGEEKIIVRNTGIFDLQDWLPYYEHGWTYQAYYMAQRKIFFNRGELHWECQCSTWHEETILGLEIDMYLNPRLGVISAGFPDLDSLSHSITTFNKKMLPHDEDVVPAISGLLSLASRTFTGGFLYGIPEMFFESGLAWKPYWSHINLRRRTPSNQSTEDRSSLPSWSWMGWEGLLCLSNPQADRVSLRRPWMDETIPTTEWHTSDSPDDPPSQRRRIRSTWFENRDGYKDSTKPMPPGWTRHHVSDMKPEKSHLSPDTPHLYPDGCDQHVFKHTALTDPDEDCDAWYYPFPVPDIRESTPPFTPEQTRYLFCETSKARLLGYRDGEENLAILSNSVGKKVGNLHLHNEESSALFPKLGETGLSVDLVVVSKVRTYSKTWNEDKREYGLPSAKRDAYAVLWVEWKDGVAYRLASGKVKVEEWDALEQERISLILG
ncbi:hypothetical protein ACHAPT_010754 [Fusarium lateritium]